MANGQNTNTGSIAAAMITACAVVWAVFLITDGIYTVTYREDGWEIWYMEGMSKEECNDLIGAYYKLAKKYDTYCSCIRGSKYLVFDPFRTSENIKLLLSDDVYDSKCRDLPITATGSITSIK